MPRDRKFRTKRNGKKKEIIVSHVTVRQSISILLAKLIFLEIIAAVIFFLFHPFLFASQIMTSFPFVELYNTWAFITAIFAKMILTIYVVLAWLNEYYEISPALVKHKKGILFVRREQLALDDIQSISLHQGLIGKIFNFGTLSLFDWKWRKNEYLYDVHNPTKYVEIIEKLLPGIDEERDIFIREHIFEHREKGGD